MFNLENIIGTIALLLLFILYALYQIVDMLRVFKERQDDEYIRTGRHRKEEEDYD